MAPRALVVLALALAACSKPTPAPQAAPEPSPSDSPPKVEAPPPAPAPTPSADPTPAPTPSASAPIPEKKATSTHVRVENIGMHIGGGPNDDVTKEPIKLSVAPHFDELAACFDASGSSAGFDGGVDLLIPEAGGKAQVSHPRSTLRGPQPDYEQCILGVFAAIDFRKPKTGLTKVSYSFRFSPKR